MKQSRFPDAPPQIAALPLDKRGFPVPWFVPWIKGEPEFRAIEPETILDAHRNGLCWVCGRKVGSTMAFVIGPMCAVNRIAPEPPSHIGCARFSVQSCPFLSRPLAKRADTSDLPHGQPPGLMIERNPGVTLVWVTQSYRFEREPGRKTGLFRIGSPTKLEWYREGRTATRDEIIESIETGLPHLQRVAQQGGPQEMAELKRAIERAVKLVPAA